MIITPELLLHIAPQANHSLVTALAPHLTETLPRYQIDTPLRLAHFLGQAAEETAGFRTLTEYATGAEYNGRRDLGNTESGDGVRYKGRGIFQITGRYNYQHYGEKIAKDLVSNPALAADPAVAVLTACEFWVERHLSTYADSNDIGAITRRINGGLNGLKDREIYVSRAKSLTSDASSV